MATGYFILYATLSVLRHESYHSLGFDSQVRFVDSLGYDQVASGYGLSLLRKRPSG
jgi:hypothetical protein